MKYKNLFIPNWLEGKGKEKEIVISSRARLARNISNYPYPHIMKIEDKKNFLKEINLIISNKFFQKNITKMNFFPLEKIDSLNRTFLLEKHLISFNMLEQYEGRGIAISQDENISILINEEDHLRIQSFSTGFDLESVHIKSNEIDDIFENYLVYGFDKKFGYLTSCPTNLGTGIRYSVMMHLPGLAMNRKLDYIQNLLKNSGCIIRGFFGEGSEGTGSLYQVSNQITIGKSEFEIRKILKDKIKFIIEKEKEARIQLWETRKDKMYDLIYRAFGTIKYSKLLTSIEAMKLLSYLRIGLAQGIIFENEITYKDLNSLLVLEQVSALQIYFNKNMDPEERDKNRPILFREILKMNN